MADNITLNAGAGGAVLNTDDIGGVHNQIIKIGFGALDSLTLVTTSAGLPVQQQGTWTVASHAVTNAGTFAVQDAQLVAGATTVAKAEDAASASADVGIPAMAIQLATPTDLAGTDADYAMLQMAGGRLWVDASGKTLTVGSHAVTNAGTFAVQATVAAGATNIAKAEDVASADADVGVPAMAVQKATPANTAGTDGDWEFLQISAGRLWASAKIDTALPAGTNVIGHIIVDTGSTTAVTGNVAVTEADGANVTLGAKGDAKSTATDTTAITIMSVLKQISASVQAPPSQAVTNAGTFAVQAAESDGANVTLGAKGDAKSTATDTTAITIMSVLKQISASVQAPPSQAVTNAGTFAAQSVLRPETANGLTTAMFSGSDGSSILVATAQVVKASAGQLYGYYAYNPEAAVTFVHFYNVAAASVTVGTTNPLITLAIPAGSAANLMFGIGVAFSNAGWSVAATTTAGGNTAPGTGVSLVAWYA